MKFLKNILGLERYIAVREKYRKVKKKVGVRGVEENFFKVKKSALGTSGLSMSDARAGVGKEKEEGTEAASPAKAGSAHSINILGYINAECGIGQIARGMIKAFKKAGIPVSVYNFDIGWHRTAEQIDVPFSNDLTYSINLCCFNAEETPQRLSQIGTEKLKGKYNIGLWAWELEEFPPEWKEAFEYVHEIWTISNFAKKSIQKATDLKVTCVPLVVEPKVDGKYDRTYFDIPKETYTFLFSFDGFSFADRKNPFSTAKAYADAFGFSQSTLLIVKTQNLDKAHEKKLYKILKGTNYRIINRYFSQDEFTGLLNSIDCYVSLHRAEGFGYGLAEAMYLKKMVIATNYSGNLDFMDESNSFLVPYKLVRIEKSAGPYQKGNHWADADMTCATEMMKKVFEDRDQNYSREIKVRAHEQIAKLYSAEHVGEIVKNLLSHL